MAKRTLNDIPVLPLRGRVAFPNTTVTVDVGRLISLNALKKATDGDSYLFLVAQRNADDEEITSFSQLYEVGTVCRIRQLSRMPGNTIRLTADGLFRAISVRAGIVGESAVCDVKCRPYSRATTISLRRISAPPRT